ncbi:hypothetical protein ACFQY4_13735 [Catellatospora bangladeshensis]|uniref:Sensor domain-containing protein n=1 Tax=Catellatospora bangladeshensis TaxID=310355 RepID=A0A8J3JTL7_9ACTN|nr:hypothetical protein [Catellatospora bangladeshensis]GIF84930.1 hypothetical protein Cba03nite_62790 [Catellatospora bangladeshensis]
MVGRGLGVVLCCVLLSGCALRELPDLVPLPTAAVPAAAAPSPSTALQAALLTVADLPPGFGYFDGPDTPAQNVQGCPDITAEVPPDARTQFATGVSGPFLRLALYQRGVPGAREQLRTARRVSLCATFTARDANGTPLTTTVEPGVLEGIGDETVALRFVTTAPGLPPYYSDEVTVRSAGLVIHLAHGSFSPVDTKITEAVVRAAVAKTQGNT